MKILVVCQHYYPEQFRITDICEELVRRGHEVTVVTGEPNYPMGRIFEGYNHGNRRHETIHGVDVHRCFTIGRRKGVFWRVMNYYSFAWSSTRFVRTLADDFDVVFVNQLSPVMMANAGLAYARRFGKRTVLYILDLWPASLSAKGIQKGSLPYRYYHRVAEAVYRGADALLVSSLSFRDYLKEEFGFEPEIVQYLPQYAESIFTPDECVKEASDTVDLMFAGNVGAAQSVETIIRAAAMTSDIPALRWHIVGDGSDLARCRELSDSLKAVNVIFHGRKPLDAMPQYYRMADAMLVTMAKNDLISRTLPGKVQTYMAAGKAVLGAIDGEAARVVREAQCGFCCEAENASGLAQLARRFAALKTRETMGKNARAFYERAFSAERFFVDLECVLRGNVR